MKNNEIYPSRGVGIKLAVVFLALVWLFLVATTWAEADESAPQAGDEYNFSWLDPDKKIYVLQNRRYLKANRVHLSVMGLTGFSNPYRTTYGVDPRLAFYFSEAFGFEGFFSFMSNSENTTYRQLRSTNVSVFPIVREIQTQMGGLLHWVPWYAKINVFNQILYFDWYFAGGAGLIHAKVNDGQGTGPFPTQDLFALYLGTGHRYHVSQLFEVRMDFTAAFYRAPIGGLTGDEKPWYSNLNFGLGFGLRL